MHQPRPHGTFGTDGDEDAAALELLARRLTNAKDLSGLGSLRMSRTLPSGAMAIAQDMGGVFKVIVQPRLPQPPEQARTDGLATTYIPALFSGVIKKAVVRPGEGVEIELTEQARRRLSGYLPDQDLAPKNVKLQRFRVGYNARCDEFNPKNPGELLHTQYAAQRPTWYSGAMAEVMQIVGGYGIQDFEELPKDDLERARMVLPPHVQLAIGDELGNKLLPEYTGVPDKKGEFQYDYKHYSTDGVAFDSEKKPWLLRINTVGVFAMPLPIVPATTTKAFREYIEEEKDDEILWILDRFGGMPSGENMPIHGADFEHWRKAGVIIKVCGIGDFYEHSMYASACGWSFNSSGSEAFNTCCGHDEDGIGYGLAYKITLKLGPAEFDGRLDPAFDIDDYSEARELDAYMSAIYRATNTNDVSARAIKYKVARSLPLVRERISGLKSSKFDIGAEIEFWGKLELGPIAEHTGNISRVGEGDLWHWAPFKLQPQIKFPEPFMGGCVSHDFSQVSGERPGGYIVRCDTIMYGYYIGDQLKVVKYFLDQRVFQSPDDGTPDDCMITGSWETTNYTSQTSLHGNFYTTDFDDRESAPSSKEVTKTVGVALGFDDPPYFAFDAPFWKPGTIWRNRYYTHKVSSVSTEGYAKKIAVCIPFLMRDAVICATEESYTGTTTRNSTSLYAVRDPTSYRYWTYDGVWAWVGEVTGPKAEVSAYPKDGNPVWVVQENYLPSRCSDFADQGAWMPGLPQDYTWLIHPKKTEWLAQGGGSPPNVKDSSYSEKKAKSAVGELKASLLKYTVAISKVPNQMYFLASPDVAVGVFYTDAVRILAGKAVYASVFDSDPESVGQRKRFGHTRLADHKSAHHFIGVINE